MSLTIYQQPSTGSFNSDKTNHSYLNSEGEVYLSLSDNITKNSFTYLYQINYEDGVLSAIKTPPWTNGVGVTTVNEKLKSLYQYEFNPTITNVTSIGANRVFNYYVSVSERFNDTGTEDTENLNKCNAFPVRLNDWDWRDYIMDNYYPGKFLSDFTGDKYVTINDYDTLQFINGKTKNPGSSRYISKTWNIRIKVYHNEGDTQTYDIYELDLNSAQRNVISNYDGGSTTINDMTHNLLEIPSGPANINPPKKRWVVNVVNGNVTYLSSSVTDIITSSDWKYEVYCYYWVGAGIEPRTSEIRTYYLTDYCPDKVPIRISWENYFGGTDYYTFELISKKKLKIDRKIFNKNRLSVNNVSASYGSYSGGYTVFDVNFDEEYMISSDYLEPHESLGLESLWTSENVYAYIEDTWYPIIIKNSEVTIEDSQTIEPVQYMATFLKSNKNYSVREREVNSSLKSGPGGETDENSYKIK